MTLSAGGRVNAANVREGLVDFQDVSVTYPDSAKPVLEHIDFQLRRGESVLFLGPSGCGKSTLAMLCAGIIPQSVEAEISGFRHRSDELKQPASIGYVFQDPEAGFCQFHVADELAFGMENKRVERADMALRMEQALREARLPVPLEANHAFFSGGMKQKLAVASALAMNSQFLIFDEPTANLDPASTGIVLNLIDHLHAAGTTMIVIEHKFLPLLDVMERAVLFDREGHIYRTGCARKIVEEEWQWLVDEGVIPPWTKRRHVVVGEKPEDFEDPRRKALALDNPQISYLAEGSTALTPAAFRIENGRLKYGGQPVWENVNIAVPAGKITAIVGPNGGGKTSLLQVLAGLTRLTDGKLWVLGRDGRDWRSRERYQAVTYCFQNPEHQFAYERVIDELANARVKDDVPEHVRHLLRQFGLEGTEEQSPFQLSQGQKRRLSVAAMLRESHDAYLLDEPTFGQDAKTQQAIADKLRELAAAGKTVIFTTHDMDLVQQIAHFTVVLAEGTVLFQGPPADLFASEPVLRQAQLLADSAYRTDQGNEPLQPHVGPMVDTFHQTDRSELPSPWGAHPNPREERASTGKPPFLQRLNPVFLLFATMASGLIAMWSFHLENSALIFALALVVMMVLGRVSPWSIVKGLLPFAIFYLLYVWSLAAYAKPPAGAPTLNFLWVHLSWYGLHQGEVLAMRMLASVTFVLMFLYAVDFPKLMVALMVNLKVPPKFASGTLAGLRVVPLFTEEWRKLRQARQLRGKAGWPWLRPVVYALPLLIQAIRMSERVAIAMEARGMLGVAAESSRGRTYYREAAIHAYDYLTLCLLPAAVLALLLL